MAPHADLPPRCASPTITQALGDDYTAAWSEASTLHIVVTYVAASAPELGTARASLRYGAMPGATQLTNAARTSPPSHGTSPALRGDYGKLPRVSEHTPRAGPEAGGWRLTFAGTGFDSRRVENIECEWSVGGDDECVAEDGRPERVPLEVRPLANQLVWLLRMSTAHNYSRAPPSPGASS